MLMEDGWSLAGGHTVQYTDLVSQKFIIENHMVLLSNVTPRNVIKK